jgi:hypothetical protein
VAYDLLTGARRWLGPAHGASYSSPQLTTIDGVQQVLLLSEVGLSSVALADGTLLWEHAWPGYPIVQPALTADGDILISVSDSSGTRRLAVAHGAGGWTVAERWTSHGLKPYFNDFVVHNGYAFGFDGSILACIDLKDGQRKWKGGRYGNGQLVLLSDQNLLIVMSEEGELALVGRPPISSRNWRGSRRSRARPGTIRCWRATSCWCGTARKWPLSGSAWRTAERAGSDQLVKLSSLMTSRSIDVIGCVHLGRHGHTVGPANSFALCCPGSIVRLLFACAARGACL